MALLSHILAIAYFTAVLSHIIPVPSARSEDMHKAAINSRSKSKLPKREIAKK